MQSTSIVTFVRHVASESQEQQLLFPTATGVPQLPGACLTQESYKDLKGRLQSQKGQDTEAKKNGRILLVEEAFHVRRVWLYLRGQDILRP